MPWASYERILDLADLFLYDIKAADPELHLKYTNTDNRLILENLKKLSDNRKRIWIRIPYIKGVNDHDNEMEAIADIVSRVNAERVELLGYHRLGTNKYKALGYDYTDFEVPGAADTERAVNIFKKKGINLNI